MDICEALFLSTGKDICKDMDLTNEDVCKALVVSGGGALAVVLLPFALAVLGFSSTGIAAGSYAASMMSAAAVASGGGVAAGSVVAILQSVGAAGLTYVGTGAVGGAGAAVGYVLSAFCNQTATK